jgi:C1A family cysteine protease
MAYQFGRLGPDPDKTLFAAYRPKVTAEQLPANVSYEYLFGPIEDQGEGGTCVAFATTALTEAILFKRLHNRNVDISERALYSLVKEIYEPGTDDQAGLYGADALMCLEKTGYVPSSEWPYGTPTDPSDPSLYAPVPHNLIKTDHELHGFTRVENDSLSLQLALFEQGPITIGINWYQEWTNIDPGPDIILNPNPDPANLEGGHEIVIVGYSKEKQAFRLRNSWGTSWGDNGYFWMPFDCSIRPDDAYTIKL